MESRAFGFTSLPSDEASSQERSTSNCHHTVNDFRIQAPVHACGCRMSKESATQHTVCVPSTSFISHRSYSGSLGLAMGSSVHTITDKVAGTAVIFTLEPWQSSVSTSQAKDPALPMARCRSRAPRALHDCTLRKAVECLTSEDLKIVHFGVRFVFRRMSMSSAQSANIWETYTYGSITSYEGCLKDTYQLGFKFHCSNAEAESIQASTRSRVYNCKGHATSDGKQHRLDHTEAASCHWSVGMCCRKLDEQRFKRHALLTL